MEMIIKESIKQALLDLGWPMVDFVVEYPKDLTHGDYASNVALVVAKQVGQTPRAVAEQLQTVLTTPLQSVATISIAGPGFLNFALQREVFVEGMTLASNDPEWGRGESLAGQKILIEYTDPNPFKEFHIGHLFTNVVGESMARLFMMGGAEVLRINYQGDVGLHVASALWGMQQLGLTALSDFTARDLGQAYAKGATAYKEDPAAAEAIREINKRVYDRSDAALNALYDKGRAVSLAYFDTIYARLGTTFDAFFFESEAGPKGKELVLSHPETFPESDGARVFVGEDYGLHTRVFLNKEGLPTYEAKELALAKMKEDHLGVYDWSVISTAKEINEYFKVLLAAMNIVYPELAAKTEHLGHGMVRLTTGKMSSRTGVVVAAVDLLDEITATAQARMKESGHIDDEAVAAAVALAAIKYATLKGNVTQDTVFDPQQALSFEGDSGPYLQYTYARSQSVLAKAAAVGILPSSDLRPAEPYLAERLVVRWPEVVATALVDREPHQVAQYLTELASAFNTFYATEKIADQSDEYAPYKALVATAVARTLKNGLWVLGIEAPQRM